MSGIGARVAQAFGALARVFGNPGLRRLELAWLGSTMGHWTYVVALSVYAYDQGGVTAVGVITVLRLLPAAVAAPFLATFADRYRRERVMMATDLSRAALMIGAALGRTTGAITGRLSILNTRTSRLKRERDPFSPRCS